MDTNSFAFQYTHEVTLPCGTSFELTYNVEAQPVAQYSHDDFTGQDYFDGMDFELLSVVLNNVDGWTTPIFFHKPGEDMRRFRATLQEAARDHYERRSGSTDFEKVAVHDRVDSLAVRIVEHIKAA